jgi:hypothetical protein
MIFMPIVTLKEAWLIDIQKGWEILARASETLGLTSETFMLNRKGLGIKHYLIRAHCSR